MKKIILICLTFGFFSIACAVSTDEFIVRANDTGKALERKKTEQIRLKKRYEYTEKMINRLKEERAKGGFYGTISSMRLSYYLKNGNKTGYRQYILNNEIRELRDERFTCIMIIIDGYTKNLKDCLKTRCSQAGELFNNREKWMASLEEYKDMMHIDFDFRDLIGELKDEAKDDLKKYLEGKSIQADERLYLLREEKNILKEAKAAGIAVDSMTGDKNAKEIQELEKTKRKIAEIIAGIK